MLFFTLLSSLLFSLFSLLFSLFPSLLGTWATKWTYLHSQHLVEHVKDRLTGLHAQMSRIDSGLDIEVTEGNEDKEPLMNAMAYIRDVRKIMDETSEMFGPLREEVALLKRHDFDLDDINIGGVDVDEYVNGVLNEILTR